MADIELNIPKDFSRCPGARYPSEGDFSGKEFRENYLSPKVREAIEHNVHLIVVLDGSAGYSTSFIEESFGGLVREGKYSLDILEKTLIIVSNEDPSYISDIKLYMKNAWDNRK